MSKHSNSSGGKRRDVTVDRISNLPDVILFRILSLLPTLDAVATILVSQRFSDLWKYINKLDFSYHAPTSSADNYEHLMRFVNFVNRVFLVLETGCIDTISIKLSGLDSSHAAILRGNLENWVAAAVAKEVKTFELSNSGGENELLFQLPSCLFSCDSLEILDITRCIVILNKSTLVCLPNLRLLVLDDVSFQGTEYVDKILSGCSVLDTLCMRRRLDDNVDRFSVCSPTLEMLKIISSVTDFASSENEEEEDNSHSKLIIDTPALKDLHLKQTMFNYFSIRTSTPLIKAEIALGTAICKLGTAEHFIEAFSPVTLLSLDVSDHWLESHGHSLVWPMFPNLTSLTLLNFFEQFTLLKDLLQNSPALETLALDCTTYSDSFGESNVIPGRISPFLKMVKVDCFCGTIDQLKVLEYILVNAGMLKTMKITTPHTNIGRRLELLQEISKFQRKSKDCRIEFDLH